MVISLTLADWPLADRQAWAEACRPKQGLKRGGAAAPLAPITRKDLERLAHMPIRLKNFCSLSLGTSFRRIGDRWWIVLDRRATKSGAADERPVPKHLNQAIAVYLTLARSILLGRREFIIGEEDDSGEARNVLTGGTDL